MLENTDPGGTSFRGMLEAKANEIGKLLRAQMPPGVGFSLNIWQFGEGGFMAYTSNCKREDIIKGLKEFIAKAEKGEL
jgi:hypothetical protein